MRCGSGGFLRGRCGKGDGYGGEGDFAGELKGEDLWFGRVGRDGIGWDWEGETSGESNARDE